MPVIIDTRFSLSEMLSRDDMPEIKLYMKIHGSDYFGIPPKERRWWHRWESHKGHTHVFSVFQDASIHIGATYWQMYKTKIQPIVDSYEKATGKDVNIYVGYD